MTSHEAMDEFEVDEDGVLRPVGFQEPTVREEYYEYDVDGWDDSPAAMADIAERFPPLGGLAGTLYEEARERLRDDVRDLASALERGDEDSDSAALREQLAGMRKKLEAMPAEPQEGFGRWLRSLDEGEFRDQIVPRAREWLRGEPSAWEFEEFACRGTGTEVALRFFQDLDYDCKDIGVRTVEGEHPGSTFYAAVLTISVAKANAAAKRHDIPIRFRRQRRRKRA